jgi:predicted lipid-binding transport protein (Tim44 family)
MKTWIAGVVIGVMTASFALDAEAQRRLGGGKSFGKQSAPVQQRQATPPQQQQPQAAPAQQANQPGANQAAAQPAAGAAAAGAAKAASPMRGALVGLAAGLGLMALASWLGFGEAFATFLLFALAGVLILALVGFLMRRRAAPAPAYAGRGPGPATYGPVGYETTPAPQPPVQRSSIEPAPTSAARPGSAMDSFARGGADAPIAPWGIPAGFDTAGFVTHAKAHFARLQAAWDSGKLDELSEFTTGDMFIGLTHELRARGAGEHHTEIVTLEADLLGIETSAAEHMASVKFDGTLKIDGEIERVHEVWNLVKPIDGKTGWLLAGIQQLS